jgi:hypothetical protein
VKVGNLVKFKNKSTVNTPGFRKDSGLFGILISHCGTSSPTGCPGLKWAEVMKIVNF